MAPSTYYATKARPLSARGQRDADLIPQLVQLWEDNYRVYGVRKLWKAARRAGHDVGRDRHSHPPGVGLDQEARQLGVEVRRRGELPPRQEGALEVVVEPLQHALGLGVSAGLQM